MRVLISLLDAQVGGGQRVAHQVAAELRKRGHEIGVLAPSSGPAIDGFLALDADFQTADIGSLRGIAGVSHVATALRGYDILYSHTSIPGQILGDISARAARCSHVIHQHTVPRVSPSTIVGPVHRSLYRTTAARRPIIAVAPHVRRAALKMGARPGLVEVVPNGVDVEGLKKLIAAVPSHDGVRVGMLARFDPQKGLDVFLRAAAALDDTDATFIIGASGAAYPDHERHVRSQAQRLAVEIVDPGNDGASFVAGLDILLMPSLRSEGLPLTLLEAMALGKAVIASDVQGIASIAGIGEAAVLVPQGDVKATSEAIRALIRDASRREVIGARGSSLIEKRFRADVAARAAADFLERLTS
jgi:glycosyltransferase involved in cell wall biosynthesis